MRLYLVRRTRSFIRENYAKNDPVKGRKYLEFDDGSRSYFPDRIPKTLKFRISEKDPNDQYARLFAPAVVNAVDGLMLPRYGLGNYQKPSPGRPPTTEEAKVLQDLSRAGIRLKGFCRTNLFKRLESCGYAFILSMERHILRNYIFLHAIENDLPMPIGTQDMGLLDTRVNDADSDLFDAADDNNDDDDSSNNDILTSNLRTDSDYKKRAAEVYETYAQRFRRRFKWLRPDLFDEVLSQDLKGDAESLIKVLETCGNWDSSKDAKLNALVDLLRETHPREKVLIFSQFADTVNYLENRLEASGIASLAGVAGDSPNPTEIAYRFSPVSNNKRDHVQPDRELRVVIATDVLSEGQNLQDGCIIVNFDLPWAIIRLIQRAGRVDRIGQKSDQILCYSFLPAEGVERIINLRSRVRARLLRLPDLEERHGRQPRAG